MTDTEEDIGGETGESKPLKELADDNTRLVDGRPSRHLECRGDRGQDIDIQALREVMYALHAVSIGTHQLLYFASMKYCKNHMDVEADSLEEAADELATILDTMNIGTLRLADKGTERGDQVLFELAENALTFDANTEKPICYFVSGYIAGYLENALDSHFVVNEIECTSQGNEVCVFRAQQR